MSFQPLPAYQNTVVEFKDETVGTNIPKQFIPGVEKGFRFMCEAGFLTGHKIAGIKFRLIDGMHHCVDSSEFAFFQAAQGAMREAFERGSWHILEPIMTVEVTAPIEYQVNNVLSVSELRAKVYNCSSVTPYVSITEQAIYSINLNVCIVAGNSRRSNNQTTRSRKCYGRLRRMVLFNSRSSTQRYVRLCWGTEIFYPRKGRIHYGIFEV